MLFGCPTLTLTPFWRSEDPVVLAPCIEAIRLRREQGCQAMDAGQALWMFESMDRSSSWGLREFVLAARLTSFSLCGVDEPRLRQLVGQAIKQGQLVALRKGESTAKVTSKAVERRRLVSRIERQSRGRLTFAGRRYLIVVDVDLSTVAGRDNYEVVGRDHANRVLDGMAEQAGTAGDLAGLLGQAREALAPDWRPPFRPDGLILLRRIVIVSSLRKSVEPAITPSALKKLRDDGWIEIQFVDAGMEPVADVDYDLRLVDKQAKAGKTDKQGLARFEGIQPGECLVRFPNVKGPVVQI
jgi:hypothetical protein